MEKELKISLINCYQKLLSHKLPVKVENEAIRDALQAEFSAWVGERLDTLLGNIKPPVDSANPVLTHFTDEDVAILRRVVEDYRGRPTTRNRLPNQAPEPTGQGPAPFSNKQVLNELKKGGLNLDLATIEDDPKLPQY